MRLTVSLSQLIHLGFIMLVKVIAHAVQNISQDRQALRLHA